MATLICTFRFYQGPSFKETLLYDRNSATIEAPSIIFISFNLLISATFLKFKISTENAIKSKYYMIQCSK